jgi:glutamate transport system permease protein
MTIITENFALFAQGFLGTLEICLYAAIGSLLLGTAIAGFRVSPLPPLRWLGTAWVNVFRNCPLAVVLFAVAFGLPEIRINGAYFWFGVVGLILYTSAFVAEAVRAGINAVSPGQAEAARAVGFTFTQSLSLIILPQALRSVVPPLGSVMIAMIKNSAIVGAFGVGGELFSVADSLSGAGASGLTALVGVAVAYLVITIPAGLLLGVLERQVAVAR